MEKFACSAKSTILNCIEESEVTTVIKAFPNLQTHKEYPKSLKQPDDRLKTQRRV